MLLGRVKLVCLPESLEQHKRGRGTTSLIFRAADIEGVAQPVAEEVEREERE